MCGGLILTVARDQHALCRYHLGRLIGYCGLGAIAGLLGEAVLQSDAFTLIPWFSTALLASGFTFLGIRLWTGKPLHLFTLPRWIWKHFMGVGPGTTGLLSAFLPCGWLHAFVLGATATRSATQGAMYLFVFWLGTLPALSITPLLATRVFKPFFRRLPRLSAAILISIGIGSLGMKMLSHYQHLPTSCHSHSDEAGD
jgi:sulfite exporter TauE/SafE